MAEPCVSPYGVTRSERNSMEHTRCWLAAYTRSRHESHVASQLSCKGLEALLPTYISDCVEGLLRLMASDHREPLNLGTEELVSVNELVDLVCAIAGKRLVKRHDLTQPQGVRGRNSDNSRLRTVLGWEPRRGCSMAWMSPITGSKRNCRGPVAWPKRWPMPPI